MNIFLAGMLKGGGDQFVRYKEAQAAQKAREKELEAERNFRTEERKAQQTFQAGESELTRQFQSEQTAEQAQNAQLLQWDQQDFLLDQETHKTDEALRQAREEYQIKMGDFALEGPLKGQIVHDPAYPFQTRPATRGDYLRIGGGEMKDYGFTVMPQGTIGTAITPSAKSGKGSSKEFDGIGEIVGTPATFDYRPLGTDGKPSQASIPLNFNLYKPQDNTNAQAIALARYSRLLDTLAKPGFIDQIKNEAANGDTRNLVALQNAMSSIPTRDFIASLATSGDSKSGRRINNPFKKISLDAYFPNEADRKWVAENVTGAITGLSRKNIGKLLGVAPELIQDYDAANVFFVPGTDKYGWAMPELNGVAQLDKKGVWEPAAKVGNDAGMQDLTVIGTVSESTSPSDALKFISDPTERANFQKALSTARDPQTGVINVTNPVLREAVNRVVSNANGKTIEATVGFIRMMMKAPKVEQPETYTVGANEEIKINDFDERMKQNYGFSRKDYAKRGIAAQRVTDLAKLAHYLIVNKKADPTLVGNLKLAFRGVKDLAQGLSSLATEYQFESATARETFQENSSVLANILRKDPEDIDATSLLKVLRVQIGYAVAAAYQGGAEGRAISDADTQNGLKSSGLPEGGMEMVFSGGRETAITNLKFLENSMQRDALIYTQYGKSLNQADFEATYIYDQSVSRVRTLENMLVNMNSFPGEKEQQQQGEEVTLPDGTKAIKKKPKFLQ